jgi:hypothetical protein
LLKRRLISASDFNLIERVDSVSKAVERINHFYRRYHSLRYVNGRLVIRLNSPIEPRIVEDLRHQFAGILKPGGKMVLSKALPEERDEVEIVHLQRLVIDFKQDDFGALRKLIDSLNDH